MKKYPKFITIETMDICNLRCSHCFIENWEEHSGFMKYESFEKLVYRMTDMIKNTESLDFSSVEALFHKRVFDMFDLVRKINPDIARDIDTWTSEFLFPEMEKSVVATDLASKRQFSIGVSPPSSGMSSLLQAIGAIPRFIFIVLLLACFLT